MIFISQPFFTTPSPAAQKLETLRQLFPQAVEVDGKGNIRVNPAAIQMALDPANPAGVRVEEDGYELRWVGKREAYHQAFVPTEKILSAAHDQSQDWDNTGNLLIKGDNLDALKLLRQSYFGKVKLIYIDPPYNTQSDQFIYRDDFSAKQAEVLSGLGYSKENIDYIKNIYGARTHSGWLSFMYPRLLLARDLLREDGVIFISIDDNEQAQLKLLCDEVFGADNLVSNLTVLCNPKGRSQDKYFATNHEYALVYSKTILTKGSFSIEKDEQLIESEYTEEDDGGKFRTLELRNTHRDFGKHNRKDMFFPLYVNGLGVVSISSDGGEKVLPVWDDGFEGCWTWGKTKAIDEIDLLVGKQVNERWKIYRKSYANGAERMLKTILTNKAFITERGQKELNQLLESKGKLFQSPKSPFYISELLKTCTSEDDVILDFFAGSGTTAEAVMRLNAEDGGQRQFILVQIPQAIDPAKQKEAHDFVTQTLKRPEATIFEITAERIRRAGAKLQAEKAAKRQAQGELLDDDTPPLDTGFRVFELVDDPLGLVHGQALKDANQDQVKKLQRLITTPQVDDMERVLSNLLLAEGLPLTTRIHTLVPEHLFVAHNVALLLQALPLDALQQHLQSLQDSTSLHYLTVYAPWVQDDNLLLGLDTLMDKLGLGKDKLRLRG